MFKVVYPPNIVFFIFIREDERGNNVICIMRKRDVFSNPEYIELTEEECQWLGEEMISLSESIKKGRTA